MLWSLDLVETGVHTIVSYNINVLKPRCVCVCVGCAVDVAAYVAVDGAGGCCGWLARGDLDDSRGRAVEGGSDGSTRVDGLVLSAGQVSEQ